MHGINVPRIYFTYSREQLNKKQFHMRKYLYTRPHLPLSICRSPGLDCDILRRLTSHSVFSGKTSWVPTTSRSGTYWINNNLIVARILRIIHSYNVFVFILKKNRKKIYLFRFRFFNRL